MYLMISALEFSIEGHPASDFNLKSSGKPPASFRVSREPPRNTLSNQDHLQRSGRRISGGFRHLRGSHMNVEQLASRGRKSERRIKTSDQHGLYSI